MEGWPEGFTDCQEIRSLTSKPTTFSFRDLSGMGWEENDLQVSVRTVGALQVSISGPLPSGLCSSAKMLVSGGSVFSAASKSRWSCKIRTISPGTRPKARGRYGRAWSCSKNGQIFKTSSEDLPLRDFPDGPMAKTPCSQCMGTRFNP